jgi:putative RNA 2'-phosphotransferase
MTSTDPRPLSKALSLILRHNNGHRRLDFDLHGWTDIVQVSELVSTQKAYGGRGSIAEIVSAVATDDKTRFEIDEDGTRIRALSGHSFEVDIEGEPFVPDGPLYFGTVTDRVDDIVAHGFTGSSKLLVRLTPDRETAERIAARRQGDSVVFEIDAKRLAADGQTFNRLSNGEVVTSKFGPGYTTVSGVNPIPGM